MSKVSDPRTVMTLDAGGANFVFSALQGTRTVVTPFTFPTCADDLPRCIANIHDCFRRVK